ncbi:hypothetical protein FQN49_008183, partial [Arthroderma sp. PD_2]
MHLYRSQARSLAWYDAEGETPSRNPFRRTKSQPKRTPTSNLEAGDNYGMADMNGNAETTRGIVPSTAGTDGIQAGPESVASTEPLTQGVAVQRASEGSESIDKQQTSTPAEEEPAVGHKQTFTIAGQLRATIFSSWINLLLFAAPAG